MNILFLTMNNFESIDEHSIYTDLIRVLSDRGHMITVLSPVEKKNAVETNMTVHGNITVIKVKTGNLFDVGLVEKAISRASVCSKYKKALDKFEKNKRYDLVLYSTPPTTLAPIVNRAKKNGAYAYLMLKDIFPQNAVDLGMIGQNSLAFKFFRRGERNIYRAADTIGCMSPANVEFIKRQDSWINPEKITVCPNAIEVRDNVLSDDDRNTILKKYGIPEDKLLFVYGGGLGKPQGIEFLNECIRRASTDESIYFVVMGSGPYFDSLKQLEYELPKTLKVIKWLPSDEYEKVVQACNVGLIMLNHRFKIPNFPSRILLYMQAHLPILAATDPNTDVGKIAEMNGFGYWCESNDVEAFVRLITNYKDEKRRREMGEKAFDFLRINYSVEVVADKILDRFGE